MLMHNKFEPESVTTDVKIDLVTARSPQNYGGEDAEMKRKQLWEIIVRMHFLSHELRDSEHDLGVSPEFTRLVSALLSEWAIMAEEAVSETVEVVPQFKLRAGRH